MTWLAWRQFRAGGLLAVGVTAAVVVVLVLTRGHVAGAADVGALPNGYQDLRLLGTVLIGLPAFLGAFWGAPLLARELEMGTHRLAWTQSVSRRRWLGTKLAVIGAATVLVTAAFSAVFTWWSLPFDAVGNRIGTANFGQRGLAPVAYAVFALALGALAGAVWRRTLPAMATTLVGFAVVRFTFQWLVRSHLVPVLTQTLPNNSFGQREGAAASAGGWILSSHTVDGAGHVLSDAGIDRTVTQACELTRTSTADDFARCADRVGLHDVVRIHPASQFWTMQVWEAACFLGLAGALALACLWWVRHRLA